MIKASLVARRFLSIGIVWLATTPLCGQELAIDLNREDAANRWGLLDKTAAVCNGELVLHGQKEMSHCPISSCPKAVGSAAAFRATRAEFGVTPKCCTTIPMTSDGESDACFHALHHHGEIMDFILQLWQREDDDRIRRTRGGTAGNKRMFFILAAGREAKLLREVRRGNPIYSTPVAADGKVHIASQHQLWAAAKK